MVGRRWKHGIGASLDWSQWSLQLCFKECSLILAPPWLSLAFCELWYRILCHCPDILFQFWFKPVEILREDGHPLTVSQRKSFSPPSMCWGVLIQQQKTKTGNDWCLWDTVCIKVFYNLHRYWFFSPTFLSCGRPYSQGNPPDGPSERSGPAIQKPNRAGNTHFWFCCSNSSNFILYFPPEQKGNLNRGFFFSNL